MIGLLMIAMMNAIAAIPINTATVEDLEKVTNVDRNTAERIVAYRTERGQINNIEALRILHLSEDTLGSLRQETEIDLSLQLRKPSDAVYLSVEEVLAQYESEPDVRQVQAMVMSYSRTNPDLVKSWLGAARRAYALPKVNLQYEKELDQVTRYDYIVADGETDPTRELDYAQAEDDDKVVVRLEWRLDKLVMSSEQIRVINEAQDVVKMREKLLDESTRLYFDRRRLQVEMQLNPPSSLREQIETELRLQEMTANLDALTGGQFSNSL
ncbi:MAG: helix-hairpin-helix domain-containing protein [Myxococcota bacterium]|nr:helix-hairpin-helix domain-containing protein [Myxococcota bacterium]